MTDVLDQVRAPVDRRSAGRDEPVGSVWIRGALAAGSAVTVGLASLVVIALVLWAADPHSGSSAGGAMRLAAQLWLVAHRTPLMLSGGSWTLPPLGLTLLLGFLLYRAASIVARGSRCGELRELGVVVASVAVPYAAIAGVIAAIVPSTAFRPSVGAAVVCAGLVGSVCAALGAVRGAGLGPELWRSVPYDVRTALYAAAGAALVLVIAATLLTLASIVVHVQRFGTILSGYRGAPGQISLILLSLLLLPNAVIFSLGYLVGPGFALGAGTSVALAGSHVGAVPGLPLLAAVPAGGAGWPVLAGCAVVVIAGGAVAGWRVTRRSVAGLRGQVNCALISALVLGLATAVVAGVAGGPSGPGRLRAVGPSPWQVGLAVALETALVAVVVVLSRGWTRRNHSPLSGI